MHKLIQQTPYYIPLFAIFVIGAFGFFAFSFDRMFQTGIVTGIGVAHVVWGVVYHFIHRDLTPLIVLEYIVFAVFGVAAVLMVLQ
jgi:multisubunit Na+/H+ antiporter MnhG subunit